MLLPLFVIRSCLAGTPLNCLPKGKGVADGTATHSRNTLLPRGQWSRDRDRGVSGHVTVIDDKKLMEGRWQGFAPGRLQDFEAAATGKIGTGGVSNRNASKMLRSGDPSRGGVLLVFVFLAMSTTTTAQVRSNAVPNPCTLLGFDRWNSVADQRLFRLIPFFAVPGRRGVGSEF